MNKRKLMAIVFMSVIYAVPMSVFACALNNSSDVEREKTSLLEIEKYAENAMLFSFSKSKCIPFAKNMTDFEASQFVPLDETSLGVYQQFRDRGESALQAIKHTLEFDLQLTSG